MSSRPGPPQPCSVAASFQDEIDGIADAGVHAEPAGRDHQVHGVAGQEHAAVAEAVGQQQVLPPFADPLHLVLQRHGDGLLEHRRHVLVLLHHGVQREVLGVVLQDELRRLGVDHVIVAALADRDALEQFVAAEQRLAKLQDVAFALQRDAELLAHAAGAAVAARHVLRDDGFRLAALVDDLGGDALAVLGERDELAAVADPDVRVLRLDHRLQQRLDGVLRDELVGLERQRAVGAGRDLLSRLAPPTDMCGAAAADRPAR